MIKIGAVIVYGTQVCRVSQIEEKSFGKSTRKYYALNPVFDEKNVIYVPCDNENLTAKMREILSEEEIYALIDSLPEKESIWIDADKERAARYKEIIDGGDRVEIAMVVKSLFEHKTEIAKSGKKLHTIDEMLLNRAERVLYEEFALVLDIKKEDVSAFISKRLSKK